MELVIYGVGWIEKDIIYTFHIETKSRERKEDKSEFIHSFVECLRFDFFSEKYVHTKR